ncbi:unnamed protein product [Amoebophrya sp. A25]|nr:unnamed protein product [Amoebophrya sp. A25]|eukprot:GSA25T00005668001.1
MPAERGTASKGAPSTMKRLPAAARLLATSSTSLSTQIVEPTENQSNASSSSTFTNEPSGWRPSGYVQQMRSHSALSNELLEKSSLATSLSRGFVAVLGSQLADEDETS